VARLADGAKLTIKTRQGGTTRRAVFHGKQGAIARHYYVNGKSRPFNAEARQWLADVIPQILRDSAIHAKARVARILKRGGPKAVLREIAKINDGYARSVYIRTLARSGSFKPPIVNGMIAAAGSINSGYSKERALAAIYKTQHPRGDQLTVLLEAGVGMDSGYETSRLLQLVTTTMPMNAATLNAWFKMAASIGSDYEARRAFSALLARPHLSPAVTERIIATAAKNLDSAYALQTTLSDAAAHLHGSSDAVAAYCKAARHIGSSYGKREALLALLKHAKLHQADYLCVLNAAAGIGSGYDRATVLMQAARQMPRDPKLTNRYRAIAKTIGDNYERDQAESAISD
jgi:hypothetical protein